MRLTLRPDTGGGTHDTTLKPVKPCPVALRDSLYKSEGAAVKIPVTSTTGPHRNAIDHGAPFPTECSKLGIHYEVMGKPDSLEIQRGVPVRYFAYGSNMSLARLRARLPTVRRLGIATLAQHALRFHKISESDGSGKCDALFTGDPADRVIGTLFEISIEDKLILDRVEGLGAGYLDTRVRVFGSCGDAFEAVTYYAIQTDASLRPYSWYLHHVVVGATETGVPVDYLDDVKSTLSIEDPDRDRDARERAIYR